MLPHFSKPPQKESRNQNFHRQGFTMMEIMGALAIIAALLAIVIPWIANWTTAARTTTDKQTLMILNEALTRYKTQGGDLNALTVETPISHILDKMARTITWNGLTQSVLQAGRIFQGRSIDAKGAGSRYHFTRYHTYTEETGGTSPTGGNIWVVDSANGRVQKFSTLGTYVSQFGSSGTGNGQFSSPTGIAIDGSGNLWVADTANFRIQKFDSSGNYLMQFGSSGTGNGQFSSDGSPWGIAIDGSGNILALDTGNYRVQKFSSTGTYLSQFGTSGGAGGCFNNPRDITVDSNGYIWVADTSNHRVQKFDRNGNFILLFGSNGNGNGEFNSPIGIIVR